MQFVHVILSALGVNFGMFNNNNLNLLRGANVARTRCVHFSFTRGRLDNNNGMQWVDNQINLNGRSSTVQVS